MINKKTKTTDISEEREINDSGAVTIFRERLGQLRTQDNASQQSISELLGVSCLYIFPSESMPMA